MRSVNRRHCGCLMAGVFGPSSAGRVKDVLSVVCDALGATFRSYPPVARLTFTQTIVYFNQKASQAAGLDALRGASFRRVLSCVSGIRRHARAYTDFAR
jgi:hypothetical protein